MSDYRPEAPLAERMRPQSLDEWVGQKHLLGPGNLLTQLLEKNEAKSFPSLIFWGPPGCGKTTIAHLIAKRLELPFIAISAVNTGSAEAKKILAEAETEFRHIGKRTLLFIDEIHRFNKGQQDVFLHVLEKGPILLIGATTENPSFELNRAILSRARVLTLLPLEKDDILILLQKALSAEGRGIAQYRVQFTTDALDYIAEVAAGDARAALSLLEALATSAKEGETLDYEVTRNRAQKAQLAYDKKGENHYNFISALHKAIRNSDPDASLLWMGRMLVAGEDPNFILRRLVRAAFEDVGMADPQAAVQAHAAIEAVNLLGYPECDVVLAQLCVYLACAPKSNSVYLAVKKTKDYAESHAAMEVPIHLRNSPTKLMKELGYGKAYQYDHDFPNHLGPWQTWPDNQPRKTLYEPGSLGFEKEVRKRIEFFNTARPKDGRD